MLCFVSESTDESEADKIHCLNNSVSSGTYSDYSPSQASSGSSNAHVKMGSLQTTAKEAVNNSLWGNRCFLSFLTQLLVAFHLMLSYAFKVIVCYLLRHSIKKIQCFYPSFTEVYVAIQRPGCAELATRSYSYKWQ